MEYPRHSPHFLACRRAVRPLASTGTGEVVVGLSGGADSLALTAALIVEGADVEAIVIDHGLQPNSDKIAAHAANQAERLGARARVIAVEVGTDDGTEAEARKARYTTLIDASGTRPLAVAHTLDDQAETLLLGALRGNPQGMEEEGRIHRPFLTIRRADTVGACAELALEHWDDPQNHDPAFRRVAIRTQIIPQLSQLIGGDAAKPLAQTATRIAEDQAFLDGLAGEPTDDCHELALQPAPLRKRRIAAYLRERGLTVTEGVVAGVDKLIIDWHGQGGVAAGYADGRRLDVRRIGGKLTVIRQEPNQKEHASNA